MLLRTVTLPHKIRGHLYLSRMPGSTDTYAEDRAAYARSGAEVVICLTPLDEVLRESPQYGADLTAGELDWEPWLFPIPDFGVAADHEAFLKLVLRTADSLRRGQRIIVHCLAGVGRSGTLAICVLMALGEPFERARATVVAARGIAEAPEQMALIHWVEEALQPQK